MEETKQETEKKSEIERILPYNDPLFITGKAYDAFTEKVIEYAGYDLRDLYIRVPDDAFERRVITTAIVFKYRFRE